MRIKLGAWTKPLISIDLAETHSGRTPPVFQSKFQISSDSEKR